jgi:uracil-DNA glycosylase family 4
MEKLYNALQLKQLMILKSLGYKYLDLNSLKSDNKTIILPHDLDELKKQALHCHLCHLSKNRTNVVFGEGDPNAKIMFVGEGPGENEDIQGRPFVGRSGELLNSIIENVLELKRENVYISNIVKCRPPQNREPSEEEANTCLPYLKKQIDIIQPKIIVALGSVALKYLTANEMKITKARGTVIKQDSFVIVPTYHPSYVLRNMSVKKDVWEDFKIIKKLYDEL